MEQQILTKYAQLIARAGINIQPGQDVIIHADLDQPEFVELLAEQCYLAGARKVIVDWNDQKLAKLHIAYCSDETLGTVEAWEQARWQHRVDTLPCRIHLLSEDPDGLRGIDQEKLAKATQAKYKIIKPYRDQIENREQWCIAAVPGLPWAKKMFPGRADADAMEALWSAILTASRVTEDPIAAWKAHNENLRSRCDYLNSLHITALHYTSPKGTDLTVGMIPQAQFKGGQDVSLQGIAFNPNIPSEEVFITPMRGKAEGVVYATKPLSYQGELIDGFSIRFENGKAVEVHAEKNEALLQTLISMDEGACYLGECALVPHQSPISDSGLLFYNTLFDENAACHLALGMGFADTIANFESYTLEQCRQMGVNDSIIHEDFMIGSAELNIDAATQDGATVPIFRNGNWAF